MFGLLLFSAGAMYLATGQTLFVRLPTSLVEAAILLVAGAVLMLIAAANMMREVLPGGDSSAKTSPRDE